MANLFDYFVNRQQQKLALGAQPQLAPRSALVPPRISAPVAQPRDIGALVAQSNMPQEQPRPILGSDPYRRDPITGRTIHTLDNNGNPLGDPLQPPATTAMDEGAAPPIDKDWFTHPSNIANENVKWLDPRNAKNPVINKDHGILGRLKDVLQQAVVSAGQEWNANANVRDPNQRLAASLGAGIAGGVGGGIDPTMDEKRQRLYDYGMARQKVAELQGQEDRVLEQKKELAQIGKLNTEATTTQQNNQLDAPTDVTVAVIDPNTGLQQIGPDGKGLTRVVKEKSQDVGLGERQRLQQAAQAKTVQDEITARATEGAKVRAAAAEQKGLDRQLTTAEQNQRIDAEDERQNKRQRFEHAATEQKRLTDAIASLSQAQAESLNSGGLVTIMQTQLATAQKLQEDLIGTPEPATDASKEERAAYTAKIKALETANAALTVTHKAISQSAAKTLAGSNIAAAFKPTPYDPKNDVHTKHNVAPTAPVSKPSASNPLGLVIR